MGVSSNTKAVLTQGSFTIVRSSTIHLFEHSTSHLPPLGPLSVQDKILKFSPLLFLPQFALSYFIPIYAKAYNSSNMMDLAQLDRCNNKYNVSLVVIFFLFSVTSITVLLRILTMLLSLPKPTKVGDRRFALAEWTMIAAFVCAIRSEGYCRYLMN